MSLGSELRSQVTVRLADPAKEPVEKWCKANSARNSFDRGVIDYPRTVILAGHGGGVAQMVFAYMPLQVTAMLESIGPNPEATPLQIAAAVRGMVSGAELLAYESGCREIGFLASDANTATAALMMGFEEMPFKYFRKKL